MPENNQPYKNDAFKLILENLSASDVAVSLFDISNSDSQQTTQYRFACPYVADYNLYKYRVTVNGTQTSPLTVVGATTPTQFAALLTAMGYGTWGVETSGTTSNTFYVSTNTNVFTLLSLNFGGNIDYSATTKNVIGTSQVAVSGLVSYKDLCESLVGFVYPLKYISIYSSNLQQVTGTFQFVRKNIDGNQNTRTINSEVDRYQNMYKTDVDMEWRQIDIETKIDLTMLASSSVELSFHHWGVFLGCEIIQAEREREFLESVFESINYSEIGL